MDDMKSLSNDIISLLLEYSKEKDGFQYINPHFLSGVSSLLYDYYELEDNDVDEWIQGMWSA